MLWTKYSQEFKFLSIGIWVDDDWGGANGFWIEHLPLQITCQCRLVSPRHSRGGIGKFGNYIWWPRDKIVR